MAPENVSNSVSKPERVERQERVFFIPGRQRGQRVGLFVDVQNMFYSAKHLYQAKINYRRLLDDLTAGRQLVRAVAYLVTKPEVDQTAFVDALTRLGYEIKVKYLKIRPDGTAKGDWAMELSLDVMAVAPRLDTVILVTGDGDYVPLVERLKVLGVRTEVVGFPQNTATELMNVAHAFVAIDDAMLFKEKKFEAELAAQAAGNTEGFAPRGRAADSIAERFAAGEHASPAAQMGVWAPGNNEGDGSAQVDDATAERLASQLWDREHNK
ncbi:MAG TPA: NYN domain-containing protein [Planctomycetota bacterium]|nr:NYN domain-containing protein [Planctomycetota bacterium]